VKSRPIASFLLGVCTLAAAALVSTLPAPAAAPAATPSARPAGAPISRQKTLQMRGFTMRLINPSDQGVQYYLEAIDEIADMGCTWINLSIATYQNDARAERITLMNWNEVPSEKNILRIIAHAKSRGMGVMLMPVVLLSNSGAKDWRGVINPANGTPESWDNWFAAYNSFITKCAQIARDGDVDIFCVGSELLSTETFRDRWINQIAQVRQIYKGKLTYSANWDHYEVVTFWDQLDYIGMNNYNELAGKTVPDLVKAWQPIKDKVLKFTAEKGKPFMFTETGWHNLDNTLKEPWNYVAEGKIDLNEQLLAFQGFIQAWKDLPRSQFMGAFIWEWEPHSNVTFGNPAKGSYCIKGTPSLETVQKWFALPDPSTRP
jgi:hypothetical protein